MNLLRIYCSLNDPAEHCSWVLKSGEGEAVLGEGRLSELPQRADRVQLVIPAAQVLLTRARLPKAARRRAGSVLAFAVEDETLGEPDAKQVIWLGTREGDGDDTDVLAVMDRPGLQAWITALEATGIRNYELHCETLLLPWSNGEWSLAWDGSEGFLRYGELEGAATDCGDRSSPPLSLRLMLEDAAGRGGLPASIAVYGTAAEAAPDVQAWQATLGVTVRSAEPWDWRSASADAGLELQQARRPWRLPAAALARLRPAAWILGLTLAIHTASLVADWTLLAGEQRDLRRQMESRFRAAFPDAVAVVDPALQMRRKLAEARHSAGLPDNGDFLPMIEKVAVAMKDLPQGGLRIVSYESGRLTLEIATPEEASIRRVVARLAAAGLAAEPASKRSASGSVVLTVRAA